MKTVGYLTNDARWNNHRDFLVRQYGFLVTGFLFGLLIALVMPVMICCQNCVRLFVEVLFCVRDQSFGQILKNFGTQSVISFESANGPKKEGLKTKTCRWKYYVGTIVSHAAFISLPIFIFSGLEFYSTTKVVCGPLKLKTKFLLDSEVELANNLTLSDLYNKRKEYGKSHEKWHDWSGKGGLLWDDYEHDNKHKYMRLTNITDFIDQFNFVGFHDICHYFDELYIETILDPINRLKGLQKIVPGYALMNSTGQDQQHYIFIFYKLILIVSCLPFLTAKNLFEVLLFSSEDSRFNQFVTCLNIMFDCPVNDLLDEYNELLSMTYVTVKEDIYASTYNGHSLYRMVSSYNYSTKRIVQKCIIMKYINSLSAVFCV